MSAGVSTQDARGLLPNNIHTAITFSCNLRALQNMLNKRLCYKTQGEFKKVADQMIKEIYKIEPRFNKLFGPPCQFGKCMMEAENEEQYNKQMFKGEQNTVTCCPIYIKKFKGDK